MKTMMFLILIVLVAKTYGAKPKWINSPYEFCPRSELCAVGEGSGQMIAEAIARQSLAKIFETKISSSEKLETSAHTKSDDGGIISSDVSEDVTKTITEKTDQVLKGVIVKATYETDDAVYALASLNKRKGAKILKQEMIIIDKRIVSLYKDGRRSSLNKILKEMRVRRGLNYKYEFLLNKNFPEKVTFEQVQKKKREKRNLATVVFLQVSKGVLGKDLERIFIKQLLDDDFRVVLDKNKLHKFIIQVNLREKEQHMNVQNFEKYKFMMKIASKDLRGRSKGALNFETIQVGRSFKQARENALTPMKDFIINNLNELNID